VRVRAPIPAPRLAWLGPGLGLGLGSGGRAGPLSMPRGSRCGPDPQPHTCLTCFTCLTPEERAAHFLPPRSCQQPQRPDPSAPVPAAGPRALRPLAGRLSVQGGRGGVAGRVPFSRRTDTDAPQKEKQRRARDAGINGEVGARCALIGCRADGSFPRGGAPRALPKSRPDHAPSMVLQATPPPRPSCSAGCARGSSR
jgi:hypothetical protein